MHENTFPDKESADVLKGGVFALGNFDGVHLGHQAVIRTAVEKARGLGIKARVFTLEPHPRSVLKPHISPFRLTPAATKVRLLKALDVDDVIVQPFTTEFLHISGFDFVTQILIKKYAAQHVVAGFDFVFGFQRSGGMQNLRTWLTPFGVGVTEVTPFRDGAGLVMSSSRTRESLQQGDLRTATHILGRPWSISGVVAHGDKRGQELSFPTANIALGDCLRPKYGVYAVLAGRVGDPFKREGVANIGVRPTVDGKKEWLEFHLFDFDQSLYGEEWEIELIDFIRSEQAFASVDDLRRQIMIDIESAKSRLASIKAA